MSIARICLLSLLAAVASCATPKMRHAEIEHAIEDTLTLTDATMEELSGVTYHATGSLLRIDEELDEEKKPTGTFTAVSLPIAADDRIYVSTRRRRHFLALISGQPITPNTRFLYDLEFR